jgi:hypothetical protein
VLVTNHVLSGALIGSVVRTPAKAFALGVVSHFALDAMPHWGGWADKRFLQIAVPDGLAGLAAIGIVAATTPPERRMAVLAGMAGAAAPDLDKPARLWFGRSPWPSAVDRFHKAIQDEAPDRFRQEMTVMAALAAAGLVVQYMSRRAVTPKGSGSRGRLGRLCRRS